MNILITNHSLSVPAGSEWVVIELAMALTRLGHRVAAASTDLGEVAGLMREVGIPVLSSSQDVPFCPDVIHGQHHLNTMEALCAWPDVPALYHCHGYVPWVETPPRHPRILRYLAMCEVLAERLRISLGCAVEEVLVMPNWVDLERFHLHRELSEKPKRALVFNRSLAVNSWFGKQIRDGFAMHGVELHWGIPPEMRVRPEIVLPDYDIVLASGRSALEAMACGCSVMPVSASTGAGLVLESNFDRLSAQNFSPMRTDPWVTSRQISEWIDGYHISSAMAVSARVRDEHSLSRAAAKLVRTYAYIAASWESDGGGLVRDSARESRALSVYIRSISPQIREYQSLLNLRHETAALDKALHAQAQQIDLLSKQINDLRLLNVRNQELETSITQLKRKLRRRARKVESIRVRARRCWRPRAWAARLGKLIRGFLAVRTVR